MLAAIQEIGKYTIERDNIDKLDIVLDPIDRKNYPKVLAIDLEKTGEIFNYVDIIEEEYDENRERGYLHRTGSASGANFTPTSKISQNSVDKVKGMVERRILGWFKILDEKDLPVTEEDRIFLENMRKTLEENDERIKETVAEKWSRLGSKERAVITIKIKDYGTYRYLGDYKVFNDLLFYQLESKSSRIVSEDKVCSICGEKRSVVMGNVSPYAFYNIDKIGYIIGGFDEKKSWRNFPICSECNLVMEQGRKYIEKHLRFSFSGIEYFLIPKFLLGTPSDYGYIFEIWEEGSKKISLKKETVKSVTGDENDILYELQDIRDIIALDFLFLRKEQSAERILLHIQDVFPSRIRTIFKAKDYVDNLVKSNFTFGTVRKFFFKSDAKKATTDLDKYFLDVLDRIFKARSISPEFMYRHIMNKIRNDLQNQNNYYFAILDGLMTILFLDDLRLIKMEGGDVLDERMFDGMFNKYGNTFRTSAKKGLFLLGSLTELLLRTQKKDRDTDNPPFLKNLKSFRLSEKDFRGLLPKVQNKLEEYNSFNMRERIIAQEASCYILQAGEKWNMTVDEMNFYFCAGMNLTNEVTDIIFSEYEKKKEKMEGDNK